MSSLFDRLLNHPEEFDQFEARTHVCFGAQCYPFVSLAQAEAAERFRYRNLELGWNAANRVWTWPPRSFEPHREIAQRGPFRVLGECWGMSSLSHPPDGGGVLLTGARPCWPNERAQRIETPDGVRVRCELGCTYDEVHEALARTHRALHNQPGFSGLTVAGNVGVGGHGSGLAQGPMASLVAALEICTDEAHAERFERGAPEFELALAHLGRLGPVTAVELDTVPAFRVAEQRDIVTLGSAQRPFADDLRELLEEAVALHRDPRVHSTEVWLAPYVDGGRTVAAFGVRRHTDDPLTEGVQRPAVLRSRALQTLGKLAASFVAVLAPSAIRSVLRATVRATATPRVVMGSAQALDFGAPNYNRVGSVELALPLYVGDAPRQLNVAAVLRVLELLEHKARTRGIYLYAPLGLRFVGAGPTSGLSMHQGREATLHIELPTFADERLFHGHEVLSEVQLAMAREHQARPHWGQRVYLDAEALRPLWPEGVWRDFARLAERLDPWRRFRNPLLEPNLG